MKKIIIMFMAISMLLISCHMNAPIDNIDVITPTNDSNDDNGNETTDETDTTDDLNDDNENDNDNTDETINYFELEDGKTVYDYDYKIKYGSNESDTINNINILGGKGVGMDNMLYHCDYVQDGRKIIFSYHKYPNTQDLKVSNVSVNGNIVTIELVDNN